jgi:hypothetical protein
MLKNEILKKNQLKKEPKKLEVIQVNLANSRLGS